MIMGAELTYERLRELLDYDLETGIFTRRIDRNSWLKAGERAGCNRSGYTYIKVDNYAYPAHRLAWLYVHGHWPDPGFVIHHINGDKSDNRFCNLEHTTQAQNTAYHPPNKSNKSGHKGVRFHTRDRKWYTNITIGGKRHSLGYFENFASAVSAYNTAERDFGKYGRVAGALYWGA